jgi:hypothetical protein
MTFAMPSSSTFFGQCPLGTSWRVQRLQHDIGKKKRSSLGFDENHLIFDTKFKFQILSNKKPSDFSDLSLGFVFDQVFYLKFKI